MGHRFAEIAFTPKVKALQEAEGSRAHYASVEVGDAHHHRLGPDEAAFIAGRDSFYIASVSETGWPYVQHRGGPAGFLRVLDPQTIALADFRGNRQHVSAGNLASDDRVALILMDYANRSRLKILGHARFLDAASHPDIVAKVAVGDYRARVERALVIGIAAYDWNCPQHITPRFSAAAVADVVAPLKAQIDRLQAENARLAALLAAQEKVMLAQAPTRAE